MKKYTVGFIFSDDFKNVLLIKKTKPADQAGLFNGIGGKFEEFDIDAAACVSREVKEETGLDIPPDFGQKLALILITNIIMFLF